MRTWWIGLVLAGCGMTSDDDEFPCGNGRLDEGEQCDDGNGEDFDDACGFCRVRTAVCGDREVQVWEEQCDPTDSLGYDGCRADCAMPSCGDGLYAPGDMCFAAGEPLVDLPDRVAHAELVDLDHDGAIDLVMGRAGMPAAIEVMFNAGSGTFTSATFALPAGSGYQPRLAIADFDGDGDLDVIVADRDQVYVATNLGARQLSIGTGITVTGGYIDDVVVGDFTGDSTADIAAAHGTSASLLPGGGLLPLGTLQQRTTIAAAELARGDFSGDGVDDLVVIGGGELGFVFATGGQLSTRAGGRIDDQAHDLRVVDFNADLRADIFVVAANTEAGFRPRVMISLDDGTFTTHEVAYLKEAFPADVDANGVIDLVGLAVTGAWDDNIPARWWTETAYGRGDGTFEPPPRARVFLGMSDGTGWFGDGRDFARPRIGDVDGDGVHDVVALVGEDGFFGGFRVEGLMFQRGNP